MVLSNGIAGALANLRSRTSARSADPEPNAGSHGSRSGNRGARRRPGAAGVWQQVAFAGAFESLEDRLLLSASFATPSYVLEGRANIASGSSHGAVAQRDARQLGSD